MFSMTYFIQTIKSNAKTWLALTLVPSVFLVIMTNVFTPTTISSLESTLGSGDSMVSNLMGSAGSSLVSFMGSSFYTVIGTLVPMVYSIMVANSLLAQKVDDGSMASLLSTPTKRRQITISSAVYLILSVITMWVVITLVGIWGADTFQPDALDVDAFIRLNMGACALQLALSGISFAASAIFNASRNSMTVGAGIPLLFFVVATLKRLSTDLDGLKYFTLQTLFDTTKLIEGKDYWGNIWILLAIAAVLYILGIVWFDKKDLPL